MRLCGVVVRALDLRSTGRGFESQPPLCRVATLGKSFCDMAVVCSVTLWQFAHECPVFLKLRPYGAIEIRLIYRQDCAKNNPAGKLKRCVDKLSKSTYPSLAPITVFVISGLESVIYWKNFCQVWWVSYGLYVINCICALMRAVFWHTCTFSGYINRLCRHTVESYCVSWIYCPIIC